MTTVPGSEIITSGLNMISQSLQIPVIIFLVIFAIFAVITLGGLISEYTSRRKISVDSLEKIIYSISNAGSYEEILNIVKNARIYESQKVILVKVLRANELSSEARHTLARKLIEAEENKFTKKIEKTDF
jgi:biopolymer transport protein ExbB/TolQ